MAALPIMVAFLVLGSCLGDDTKNQDRGPGLAEGEGEGEGEGGQEGEGEGEGEGGQEGEGEGDGEGEGEPREGEGEGPPPEGEGEGEPQEGEGEGEGEPREGEGEGEGEGVDPCEECEGPCDPSTRQCVECLGDEHCDEADKCRDQACVPRDGCQRDDDCADAGEGHEVCYPQTGRCVQCLRNASCARGSVCTARVCVPGCGDDRDCPDGAHCREDGAGCVACVEDQHCGERSQCVDHECTQICERNEDCGDRRACDIDSGICVDCLADPDCALGEICEGRHCEEGCRDSRDCQGDLQCSEQGQCVRCIRDDQCPEVEPGAELLICTDGECLPGCRDRTYCRGNDICHPRELRCGACGEDADCPEELDRCVEGLCLPGCGVDEDCAGQPDTPVCGERGLCIGCEEDAQCGQGVLCREGRCACGEARIACGGQCIERQVNREHCGHCDNACADDVQCISGGCGTVEEETEPNNSAEACQQVVTGEWRVIGEVSSGGDRDWYCFWAAANQRVVFDIDARSIRSHLDSYIWLHALEPEVRLLAENDDERRGQQDSILEWRFARAGNYAIEVGAWRDQGCDEGCIYRLTIR